MAIQTQYANERVRVDEERGVVFITDFSLNDQQVAEYFASQVPDQREDRLEAAIRAGVLALKSADVGERVDYVKKEFERLRGDVERKMNDAVHDIEGYLGEDGKMPRMMEGYIGKEGEVFKVMEKYIGEGGAVSETAERLAAEWADTLRSSMDPRNEKSPLHGMRQDILDRLDMMMEGVVQRRAEKEIKRKTPIKGFEFEEYGFQEIGSIAHVMGDVVENTTKMTGSVPYSKKGDLVIEVANTSARIVIEVKDIKAISENKARETLDASIENRGAHFGLLVVKNVEAFKTAVGWFHEFGSTNKLAVALGSKMEDNDADSWIIHGEILLIAYKWARARAMANALEVGKVDTKAIAAKMDMVKDHISQLSSIKSQVTTIEKAAGNIRSTVAEVAASANAALEDVAVSLKKVGAKGRRKRISGDTNRRGRR